MEGCKVVDPLHPLVTAQWEECCTIPECSRVTSECVLWNNRLYVGLAEKRQLTLEEFYSAFVPSTPKLLELSSDFASWRVLTNIPISYFGLGTYHSQLVLVGGRGKDEPGLSDQLWVSDEDMNWCTPLPPMPTKRFSPTVVNTGSPEYLVVVGGMYAHGTPLNVVEVLMEGVWFTLERLPLGYSDIKHTIHNGSVFLTGRHCSVKNLRESITYCELTKLINACESALSARDSANSATTPELWSYATTSPCYKHLSQVVTPVPYGPHLVMVGTDSFSRPAMFAYSPFVPAWLLVDTLPIKLFFMIASPLSAGALVLIGEAEQPVYSNNDILKVVKASLRVSLYNPAAQYERHALSRLQAVGIPVVTSIAQNHRQFCKICQLVTRKWPKKTSQFEQGEQLVSEWERANYSALTWSGLYEVLRRLELEELSQQIEEYFTSVRSLKEQCMSVIMSALLRQRSPSADQVSAGLPHYIPTSIRRDIVNHFKAYTFQLFETERLPFLHKQQQKVVKEPEEEQVVDYDVAGLFD